MTAFTTSLLIIVMVLGDAASDVLMARAMRRMTLPSGWSPGPWLALLPVVLTNRDFVAAICGAALHFFSFLALLAVEDLSFVIPAAASVYIVSTLGARFVLKERVSMRRWWGVSLIALGVALVSIS